MRDKIDLFKLHVRETAANPKFLHHQWFVQWHLEIVERIAFELFEKYPEANRSLVGVMVWLHDYGKIIDFDNPYTTTLTTGQSKLLEIGFDAAFVSRAVNYIDLLDKKLEVDLHEAPIEVQIVSSADGCAHLTGPFMHIFWHETTDKTFTGKTYQELMQLNLKKAHKDWRYKIVLPQARQAFEKHYQVLCEQSGELPAKFLQ